MKTVFLGFLITYTFNFHAQSQIDKYASSTLPHKQIYLYLGNIGLKSKKLTEQYNIKPIFLIGGHSIDPKDSGYVNFESLKNDIIRVIPNVNATGVAILDWEGRAMNKLNTAPLQDSEFNRNLNEYRNMINIAKSIRPKVKWGIYGLPFRNYWDRNDAWKNRAFMLMPLLSDCDIITPSVYDFYPDSIRENENKLYIEDNVLLALEIGQKLNKPVLPFVTHRLPNSKLIPKKEFISHIGYIFKTKYLGKNVDGIIWWGPDEYYYNTRDKEVRNEVENEVFADYFDKLIYNYLLAIVQLSSFKN